MKRFIFMIFPGGLMKLAEKLLLFVLAGSIFIFAGCSGKKTAGGGRGYDLYIFNTKGENAEAMKAAADAFGKEKGITVKVFSLGSGTNSDDTLRTEMSSKDKPAIFSIMNSQALVEWVEGKYAMDFSAAKNQDFKKLADTIPPSLRLQQNGVSYGIPYNVEGYGFIVNKNMLADLFGKDSVDSFIEAFKTATYKEFENMVHVVEAYIKNGTAGSVTLSGSTFKLAAQKTGLAKNLTGVFSVAGSEKWTYGDHLVNIAIDTIFPDAAAAKNTTKQELEAGKSSFTAYAKTLDLMSQNATTLRGPDLINATINGYDQSVATFAAGKALFLKQGNWAYGNIERANPDITKTLTFLPVKMPFTQSDIHVQGLTVEHMNDSIPVFVPNYYAINAKVSDREKELAEEFLVWLNTSEEGQDFIINKMSFIPYNADPAKTSAGYSLGDSIISYMAQGKTITNAYAGAPVGWATDNLGGYLMEHYLNKETWPDNAYDDIAGYAVSRWEEMANIN
jgi:raffinose/stachyose/melibiose transport system substrate-binding protein